MSDLTPDDFRELGRHVLDWVAKYRETLDELPVRSQVVPGWVAAELRRALPDLPEPVSAVLDDLDRVVVPGTTHWQHPSFFGYFPANASLASVLGDLISGGLGSQGMSWSTSPACTELEQVLLDQLADLLGLGTAFTFPGGGGGVLQDSASSGALTALLAALQRARPDWRDDGVDGRDVVYVSTETHSSLEKAVRVAGIGRRGLRAVAVDGTGAMDPGALAEAVRADRAAGLRPVLCCATVGTTGTGAVDPIGAIAEVCAGSGAWLHVDAAWAGAAAICPELRGPFGGIGRADSVSIDAHKWLLTAFDASMLWTRHPTALPDALAITPAYLRDGAIDVTDYRDWHVPLGRRFRALKIWMAMRTVGLDAVRSGIRDHVTWAADLADRVRADPRFELVVPPSFALVCLRMHTGAGAERDDEVSERLVAAINDGGAAMLTATEFEGRYVVRVAIGSVATERRHVDALWELLCAQAGELTAR